MIVFAAFGRVLLQYLAEFCCSVWLCFVAALGRALLQVPSVNLMRHDDAWREAIALFFFPYRKNTKYLAVFVKQ